MGAHRKWLWPIYATGKQGSAARHPTGDACDFAASLLFLAGAAGTVGIGGAVAGNYVFCCEWSNNSSWGWAAYWRAKVFPHGFEFGPK